MKCIDERKDDAFGWLVGWIRLFVVYKLTGWVLKLCSRMLLFDHGDGSFINDTAAIVTAAHNARTLLMMMLLL